jgi:glycosyltransferase involved in cell wall biosynthesis
MRIFYLARLFSGLESSFVSRQWSPTGVPTIYKVIERIDKKHEAYFMFTAKDSGNGYFSSWHKSNDKELCINGLSHNVTIVSGVDFFPVWLSKRVRMMLREIRQIILILYKIYKFKPDVLYCDHANIIIAALFSRVQKRTLVVFRVMGVNQSMRISLSSPKIYHRIYNWAYRSPFSLAICTQDGSGVEKWTSRALSESVKTEILLNGIDCIVQKDSIDPKLKNLPSDKVIIMFVGKLEKYKGCYEFVQAILNLVADEILNAHALIIGSGTEEEEMVRLINNAGASSFFTFIKLLPHSQIIHAHSICDIYVSMNHLGNLSNANLEAIQSNDCMIIPAPQKDNGIDEVTASLLGESIINVPINQPDKLSNALSILISSKSKREMMSQSIKKIKKDFIWSWDDRINTELDIIEQLERGVS